VWPSGPGEENDHHRRRIQGRSGSRLHPASVGPPECGRHPRKRASETRRGPKWGLYFTMRLFTNGTRILMGRRSRITTQRRARVSRRFGAASPIGLSALAHPTPVVFPRVLRTSLTLRSGSVNGYAKQQMPAEKSRDLQKASIAKLSHDPTYASTKQFTSAAGMMSDDIGAS
jgi:hypothetical protein